MSNDFYRPELSLILDKLLEEKEDLQQLIEQYQIKLSLVESTIKKAKAKLDDIQINDILI